MKDRNFGPNFCDYMETRLNLLNEKIKTLEENLITRISDMSIRYQQRFESQQEAILKSELSNDKRFESVNEFRKTLADQSGTLMPRSEAMQIIGALSEKINKLENRVDMTEGTTTGSRQQHDTSRATIGIWIGVASVVAGLVALLMKFL